jgi:hypothetical protein
MAADISLYKSVIASDIPHEKKTAFQRIFERLGGARDRSYLDGKEGKITGDHAHAAGLVARDGAAGVVTGAALGYVDSKMGLDIGPLPLDLAGAVVSGAGSVALGAHPLAREARNVTSSCLTVLAFRKMKSFQEKKRAMNAAHVHGETSYETDPILRVAKSVKG